MLNGIQVWIPTERAKWQVNERNITFRQDEMLNIWEAQIVTLCDSKQQYINIIFEKLA